MNKKINKITIILSLLLITSVLNAFSIEEEKATAQWSVNAGTLKHEQFSGSLTQIGVQGEYYLSNAFGAFAGLELWMDKSSGVLITEAGLNIHLLGRSSLDLSVGIGVLSFSVNNVTFIDFPAVGRCDIWMSKSFGVNATLKYYLASPGLFSVTGGISFRIN